MPLDQSFVGRSYPPENVYDVSRAKIKEFATAIGERSPLCHDAAAAQDAGYPDLIAPPTFLTVINLTAVDVILRDPELGLDFGRLVHGDQSFTHQRPVHAGDRLAVTSYVDNIMARAGNDFMTIRAEIHDADDKLVAVTKAQFVVRGEA